MKLLTSRVRRGNQDLCGKKGQMPPQGSGSEAGMKLTCPESERSTWGHNAVSL